MPINIDSTIITSFRDAFPYVSDDTKYTDDLITEALIEGDAETGGSGWGVFVNEAINFKRRGMFAYAMHYILMTYPKGVNGPFTAGVKQTVQSKSVGDESTTYNTGNVSKLGAGDDWFMGSQYGQNFLRFRKRAGRGARTV